MIKNALNIIINHSFKMEATQHPPTGKWIKKKKKAWYSYQTRLDCYTALRMPYICNIMLKKAGTKNT